MDIAFWECSGKLPCGVNIIWVSFSHQQEWYFHYIDALSISTLTCQALIYFFLRLVSTFFCSNKNVKYYYAKFNKQSKTELPKGRITDI